MTNLPLGLPDGSVRSILALALTATTVYLWATHALVPTELLAVNSLVLGHYFGSRSTGAAPEQSMTVKVEEVDAPYIPEGRG